MSTDKRLLISVGLNLSNYCGLSKEGMPTFRLAMMSSSSFLMAAVVEVVELMFPASTKVTKSAKEKVQMRH